jgi:hypothetical protein
VLHLAAAAGHPEIVDQLLTAATDVNAQNRFGDTPLIIAAGGRCGVGETPAGCWRKYEAAQREQAERR